MNKLYIIIPAYNEEECIGDVIHEWYPVVEKIGNDSKLVVINDGSKDNTLKIVSDLKKEYKNLEVIDKPNSGHGPSCLYGYKYSLEHGADYIFQADSDGQAMAKDFWDFWESRDEADFIIGFRPKRGDGIIRWIISRVLRLVILIIFRAYVLDSNVPFRLMKSTKLKRFLNIIPNDFFLANSLLVVLLVKEKESIKWTKISFEERKGGIPSVSLKRFFNVGLKVIKDFRTFNKMKKGFSK